MKDEDIVKLYNEGNGVSHTNGLRVVFEAGRNQEATVAAKKGAPAEREPFEQMTNAELRTYLDARGVAHTSSDAKADLERMARAAELKEKAGG